MKPRAQERVPFVLTPLPQAEGRRRAAAAQRRRERRRSAAARNKPAAPAVDGVTFIDFKKAAAEQRAR